MDPDAMIALTVAALTSPASDKALSFPLNKPNKIQTVDLYHRSHEHTAGVLDALAGVCAREKNEVVAIGLQLSKPIELILATNEDRFNDTITTHLTTICSMLKKISDQIFSSRLSKADEEKGSPKVDSEDMNVELEDLYHQFFLVVYSYSYDKLMLRHAKWWSTLEAFRAQSLEWVQKMKQERGEPEDAADLVGPNQSIFRNIIQFRENSMVLQHSLFECCQAEKVGSAAMQLLVTRWQQTIIYANSILVDPSACEFWATKVAIHGPVLQLRRAVEKLVEFHQHVFTILKFASLPRMRPTFFSAEIRVTSIEKERPALLKWPSDKAEWMDLLSTIYIKQGLERETGQTAKVCEQFLTERAVEHGRAKTVNCECAIVAYLHPHSSSPAFFYVGVSKYSCKPSYDWIKAYNDTAGTIFRTKGTNNKWCKGWARPGLSKVKYQETVDARFLEMVENVLCARQIEVGMAKRRSASDRSDSSEYMVSEDKSDDIEWDEKYLIGAEDLAVL